MRDVNLKPCAVFALNGPTLNADMETLSRYGIVPLVQLKGSYKGIEETSFLVELTNTETYNQVLRLCKDTRQESILLLDQDRNASLFYLDSYRTEALGRLTHASKDEALTKESWSYNPNNDTYYIIG